MLDELIVNNLGIIGAAHIEPGSGLVVVTGETGAGKTMLLGALRLLTGASARRDLVGPMGEEATVDGRFIAGGEESTVKRRVTAEGRSKAYLDGSMVPVRALQERAAGQVEVIGQHDHMMLTSQHGARQLVDGALGSAGREVLARYAEAWQELVLVRQKLELLGGSRRELERELEVVSFQADDITRAGFQPGDDADLAARADRLRNAEDLARGLASVLDSLGDEGAAAGLASASAELGKIARLDPSLAPARHRLEELSSDLAEIQLDLAAQAADLDHEPGELDTIELRIAELSRLKRKYGDSLNEVLDFAASAATRAEEITELLGTADQLAGELAAVEERAERAGERLTGVRTKSAKAIAKIAAEHLRELGMSNPTVEFEITPAELGPAGADRVALRFASDAALPPGPANKIASGGELSRLTLALRLAAGVDDASLLAFDEVDAGIGGAIALAMGEKLATLAKGRQLFCVTHLPQVAAFADTHFVVERNGPHASVRHVEGAARLEELSRMLGGLADSERGQLHAAELLEAARQD